ncbi:sensor histidine kinase [Pseudoalteromonas luteoviolacea]|uniref:histidine kinase n=1 Tax=Pseudoalteromonas luteoviolacea S4054 TaxID=1129367 RepID=A0A0F6A845_9GAMM|nr:HAMP domain-containing sensor histidine kinase [Pseudoalteromonas luteoviolacea]AOT07751.1 hypothetical protein S4054249_07820 [Pseudoalteromonas luteoviolacea]AOT12667.1 hypothetical protein S40542_07820 [Pseudoalteromonas luteoviolacea]AOT17580.1 hypothetical protein S4054_07815 [Pseudoalteromonas luteoviolacea]KKE81579.1 hypothetical protein N479_22035 [Pseudoalteromonas luteoviolacea S4054]KZN78885.1 hypothetical protein N481_00150 [Pseudoalteromonas luteoviolacea S4047-1]
MKLKYLLFIVFLPIVVIGPAAVGVIAYQFIEQTTFDKLRLINDIHTKDFIGLHVESRNQALIKNKLDGYADYVDAYKQEVLLEINQNYEHYDGSFLVFDNTLERWFYNSAYLNVASLDALQPLDIGNADEAELIELGGELYFYTRHSYEPWQWEIFGIYPLAKTSDLLLEIGFVVFWVCVFILVLLFLITSFIYRYLFIAPLHKITQFSENVARLKLDDKLVISSPLEFAMLSQSLEKMRVKLGDNIEKIETANEELSQFSYRTSHDLKSPLTASKQLAKYVLEDMEAGNLTEAKNNVERIFNQASKLESLVDDILSLTRVDLQTEENQAFDIHDLIEEIKVKRDAFFHSKEVDFEVSVALHPPVILGQRARYKQIIENLLSNAFKYIDSAKSNHFVKITVKGDGADWLVIEVEDNGVGIPEAHHDEVFEMFKRFHPHLSSGSGLGLAIVKKHVDKMQGYIKFETSKKGTRFLIYLKRNT